MYKFNICQKQFTHSIISKRIDEVHKTVKQNRKQPDMTTNLLTVPVVI